jgi:ParB family chromosome partitioning protein
MKRLALGRGLDALIPSADLELEKKNYIMEIELSRIKQGSHQPRKNFNDEKIKELAETIHQKGLIQPIILKRTGENFELVVGERRLRAAKYLKLKKISAVVYDDISKQETMELALIENIQRENLNPIEEAEAYRVLLQEYGLTQSDLASRTGKDRSSIANYLRLLTLPDKVRHMVGEGKLPAGAARVILAVPGEKEKIELAERTIKKGYSVRELEKIVYGNGKKRLRRKATIKSPFLLSIEEELKSRFRTKISIVPKKKGGRIIIEYYDNESLSRIIDELKVSGGL